MRIDDRLRDELMAMRDADQAVRHAVASSVDRGSDPVRDGIEDPATVDARNARRLSAIIAEAGWPSEARVGRDGTHAAWLIVQRARHDPAFQRHCLDLILDTAGHGLDPVQIALLTDAVAVAEREPELYGTQGSLLVHDPAHVDERRQGVGLGPLQLHLAQLQRWRRNPDGSIRRLAVINGAWVEVPTDYDPTGVDGAGRLSPN